MNAMPAGLSNEEKSFFESHNLAELAEPVSADTLRSIMGVAAAQARKSTPLAARLVDTRNAAPLSAEEFKRFEAVGREIAADAATLPAPGVNGDGTVQVTVKTGK